MRASLKPIHSLTTATVEAPYVAEYHPYDSQLPDVFEKIKGLILGVVVGPVSVEHVGSSAIPGLGGRNALDIAVAVERSQQAAVTRQLHKLGFQGAPFPHYLPLMVGEINHRGVNYQILLYVVSPASNVLADWLKFRDYMRTHPDDARDYAVVKQKAIAKGKAEGEDYQEAKNPFFSVMSQKLSLGREG